MAKAKRRCACFLLLLLLVACLLDFRGEGCINFYVYFSKRGRRGTGELMEVCILSGKFLDLPVPEVWVYYTFSENVMSSPFWISKLLYQTKQSV